MTLGLELLVDLGPETMHQHNLHTHTLYERQILCNVLQFPGGYRFTCNAYYEGFTPVRVDVRCHRTEPRYKREIEHGRHGHAFEIVKLGA